LPTVEKSTYQKLDIYVIDDGGSTDGSIEYVKTRFPHVKLIVFAKSLGFAEAYNQAMRLIESDYVILLNNDTQVLQPDWVQELVRELTVKPRVAAVTCRIVSMKTPSILDSVGAMGIPYWRGFVDIGKGEKDRDRYKNGFEPFAFSGAAAMISRKVFINSGGFDSRFRFYVEDSDLSWRFRLYGFSIGFASRAMISHYYSGTIGPDSRSNKLYFCHRNLLATILKNCGSTLGWAIRNYLLYSLILALGLCIHEPLATGRIVKAVLWNIQNFRDTYSRRLIVQQRRCVSDSQILDKLFPRIARYHPQQYTGQRRILNILFESSQLTLLNRHLGN
jgi:hypothetical protein